LKRERLNHFLCFGLKHLDYIVQLFVDYHNTKRPYQRLGNLPLPFQGQPPPAADGEPLGRILRERILGGLLNHYYRDAA
jgi:putative transposase